MENILPSDNAGLDHHRDDVARNDLVADLTFEADANFPVAFNKYSSLSCNEDLYHFPKEKVAIIDEDGNIVAANNRWLATSNTEPYCANSTPTFSTNYFDFLGLLFPAKDALSAKSKLKEVICGRLEHFSARIVRAQNSRQLVGEIIAFPVNDSPSCLVLVHNFDELDE